MERVTDTFGSIVGHHNLMQVVGAHTLEEHRKMKAVIQYYNCIMTCYTILEANQTPAHKQRHCGSPTTMKTKRFTKISLNGRKS